MAASVIGGACRYPRVQPAFRVNIRSAHLFGQKVRDTGGKAMYKLVHGRGYNDLLYP